MDIDIKNKLDSYINNYNKSIESYNLKESLESTFSFLDDINKYVDTNEPWKLIKDETKREEVINIFFTISESLRQV
jgi:methionyl-tRNA synthetase